MDSSVPFLPTVDIKYPADQNSPPQNHFFTSGTRAKISRAVILFTMRTILVGSYVGTDWMRKCT